MVSDLISAACNFTNAAYIVYTYSINTLEFYMSTFGTISLTTN